MAEKAGASEFLKSQGVVIPKNTRVRCEEMTEEIETQLRRIIPLAWCRNSSMSPSDWSSDNPAIGQCGPTSCVLQDYLGGNILYCVVKLPCGNDVSHYCNQINGKIVDRTGSQFESDSRIVTLVERRDSFLSNRELILNLGEGSKRYEILKKRVDQLFR